MANDLDGVTHAIVCPQPWASITVEGPRTFHNLDHRPPSTFLGMKVAVLAAAKPDTATAGQAIELLDAEGFDRAKRATWTTRKTFGAIIGTAVVVGIVSENLDPWFIGPYAFQLERRMPLATPVAPAEPCTRKGGIWRLP